MLGIFLDIETNGLDPFRHQPLEIAIVIMDLSTGERYGTYESMIACDRASWEERDPNSLSVNGFSYPDLQSAKTREEVASAIIALFDSIKIQRGKAVFICQNPSFDRPFFAKIISSYIQEEKKWPYHWLDLASMYWARFLAHEQPKKSEEGGGFVSVSKDVIAQRFGLGKEKHPHRAMNGVCHLIECYEKVVGFPHKTM